MKHYRLHLLIAAIVALSATAGATNGGAFFKFPNVNPVGFTQFAPFLMQQGWEDGEKAWFIATDTSDLQIAGMEQRDTTVVWRPNFAPALANLAGQVATVYIITNRQQGPVFSADPGDPTYSGLWQVVYVKFNRGSFKHYVTNTDPYHPIWNPAGLPSVSDATFTYLNKAGLPIVVKYPIVALGPLGGPWAPAIPGDYRIAQGKVMSDYTRTKILWLPIWEVFCKDPVTKQVDVRVFAVPDVFDPPGLPLADRLAPKLMANVAPGLGLIDPDDTQPFYLQLGPQPVTQLPILHACPDGYPFNSNYDYIPVETVVVLGRNVPPLSGTLINNENLLLFYEFKGFLTLIRDTQVINATIVEDFQL